MTKHGFSEREQNQLPNRILKLEFPENTILFLVTEFPVVNNVDHIQASSSVAEKTRVWEMHKDIPMVCWKANMVLAWLEVECQMSTYSQMCYENIKSGKVLLELTDAELEAGLGIVNTMHRRKLRLAIEDYREPTARLV